MNKKIILTIFLTIILLSVCLNPVTGVDEGNWGKININGIDFKIPPKYTNGELVGDTYLLEMYLLSQ